MKRPIIKIMSLVLVLTFTVNSVCYGLATLPASQNPIVKREIEAALQRTQIRYAESEDAKRLLNANNASCLLLSSGKYLVTKEVAENDLKLLRAIIHEDIEAIMQIIAKEDRYKYQGIKELILKYFPPGKDNKLPIDLYVNHTVARAFEWLSLLENKIIIKGEILPEDVAFINAVKPIIMASKHNYFTGEFWDDQVRKSKIRIAISKGFNFAQVASQPNHLSDISQFGHQSMYDRLSSARKSVAENNFSQSISILEPLIDELKTLLANAPYSKTDPYLLSNYFSATLLLKVSKAPQRFFNAAKLNTSAQIFVFDTHGRVLLQKRGAYKRLFPSKDTVSANAKLEKGDSSDIVLEKISASIKEETGIVHPDPNRIKRVGSLNSYMHYMRSYTFEAFNGDEAARLEQAYKKRLSTSGKVQGRHNEITLVYDPVKHSLVLYILEQKDSLKSELDRLAETIKTETSIPNSPAVENLEESSLFIYTMNADEEYEIVKDLIPAKIQKKKRAREDMAPLTAETLKDIDSDDMELCHWWDAVCRFRKNHADFAEDLTASYFNNENLVNYIAGFLPKGSGYLLHLDDPKSADPAVSGGKGSNLHILRMIGIEDDDVKVPDGFIVSAALFEKIVLQNKDLREKIDRLDKMVQEDRIEIKSDGKGGQTVILDSSTENLIASIRDGILKLKLPESFMRELPEAIEYLGGKIAVRSSASVEDQANASCAGKAKSFLNQTTLAEVVASIKGVWASLFDEGFLSYRIANKMTITPTMPVVLLKMVPAQSAGVLFSIEANTGRPAFRIEANFGFGESVVSGQGFQDQWKVSPDATMILEKKISKKEIMFVETDGGTREKQIDADLQEKPSMNDAQVLQLACIALKIQQRYIQKGVPHVDIEFAIDKTGTIYILQTRPETTTDPDKVILKFTTVDDEEEEVKGTVKISLDGGNAITVVNGVATGRLIIAEIPANLPDKELQDEINKIVRHSEAGDILVAIDTDNKWDNAFMRISGVITNKGGWTSHAARTAGERLIPCLVAAGNATTKLKEYAKTGKAVTLDAYKKAVYLTSAPSVKTVEIDTTMWRSTQDLLSVPPGPLQFVWRTNEEFVEGYRRWENFMEDFEGVWRGRPKTPFGYLELDYYAKAFDRYADNLNHMFPNRQTPFRAMPRKFKNRIVYTDLMEEADGLHNVLHQLSLDEFEKILKARVEAFEKADIFFSALKELSKDNIAETMDYLVELLSWMHIARPFHIVFNPKFVQPQERFISKKYMQLKSKMNLAALENTKKKAYWPNSLTHWDKIKEAAAIEELIRMDKEGRQILLRDPRVFPLKRPTLYRRIEDFAKKWKMSDEDIRKGDDTEAFVELFRGNTRTDLAESRTISSQQLLRLFNGWDLEDGNLLHKVRSADPDLYLALQLYAKIRQERLLKGQIKNENMVMNLALKSLQEEKKKDEKAIESFRAVFSEYPTLKRIISIDAQEFYFMEDAHQLISRYQKKLYHLLLSIGQKHPDIFQERPELIFDLSTDEIIALLCDTDTSYLKKTFKRHEMTEAADATIEKEWSANRARAIEHYAEEAENIKIILRDQEAMARYDGVKAYYKIEIERIDERVKRLLEADKRSTNSAQHFGTVSIADNEANQFVTRIKAQPIQSKPEDKNLSRGNINETSETHPALDKAANEGRMFAVTLEQLGKLHNIDNETLADLLMSNLLHLRSPPETRQKLLNRLQDSKFKQDLIKGFALMSESVKDKPLPNNKPIRLCIVIEDENLPTIVFKDSYNNLIAHSGKGEKTSTPYTSIYAGYHSLEVAFKTDQEDGFRKIIIHEADDIVRGYHLNEKIDEVVTLHDKTLDLYDTRSATTDIRDSYFTETDQKHMTDLVKIAKEKIANGELDPRLPVVARIVDKDGNIIATSIRTKLEKPSKHGVKALHAEVSAIREAEAIGFTDWANATMYVTIDSCYTCSRTITEFYPFKRVVYGVEDPTLADYSRNKEGYANNGIALVECNNKAIQQEIRTLFNTIFQSEPRDTPLRREMLAREKELVKYFRNKYREIFGEDIQVTTFNANIWARNKIDRETNERLFAHLEWFAQDINPNKKHVLLIIGENIYCKEARRKVINDGIFKDENILLYNPDMFPKAVTSKPVIDMHIHSTSSDGELSPREIIQKAAALGLKAISITDHDDMSAYLADPDLFNFASQNGIELIAGVEASSLCWYKDEAGQSPFADGYWFSDLVAFFPKLENETEKAYRDRLQILNGIFKQHKTAFKRCVLSTFARFKKDYPKAKLSYRELLDKAISVDRNSGFLIDNCDDLWRKLGCTTEESFEQKIIAGDNDFLLSLPRCLSEFAVTLRYLVDKSAENNVRLPSEEKNYGTTQPTTKLNIYILNNKDRYFGKSGDGWTVPTMEEVVKLIKENRGFVLLAHPHAQRVVMGSDAFENMIQVAKEWGLDGIEAFSRGNTGIDSLYYNGVAYTDNLLVTNGSDFHGPHVTPDRQLGIGKNTSGNQTSVEMIEKLEEAKILSRPIQTSPLILQPLTKEFAEKHIDKLIELQNTIPDVNWEPSQLLRDRWDDGDYGRSGEKVFLAKWEHSIVAVDDAGNPIGLLLAYERPADEEMKKVGRGSLYIHGFAVDPQWQRRGVGKIMMRQVAKNLIDNGFQKIDKDKDPVITVKLDKNTSYLKEVYESFGFEYVDEKVTKYKEGNDHDDYIYAAPASEVFTKTSQKDFMQRPIVNGLQSVSQEEGDRVATLYNDTIDLYDAGEFKVLWFDVLDKAFQEDGIYKIKYDTSRLTNSQIAIIKEYVRLLNMKTRSKFEAVGCSSSNGSKETLLTVYRQDKAGNTIGKGCVDIDIPEGDSIEQYVLRITGMLNMALAASSIEENSSDEIRSSITGFIKRQCRLMVDESVPVPDSIEDLIKFIRNLPLPKASRMPTEKIEEYNRLAKEALTAA